MPPDNEPGYRDELGPKPGCDNKSPIPNITAEELGEHLVTLRRQVQEMHHALVGNIYNPRGFIKRLEDAETRITAANIKLEEHDRKLFLWSSFAAALGAGLVFLKDFLTHK